MTDVGVGVTETKNVFIAYELGITMNTATAGIWRANFKSDNVVAGSSQHFLLSIFDFLKWTIWT